jgi:hypothetical protein
MRALKRNQALLLQLATLGEGRTVSTWTATQSSARPWPAARVSKTWTAGPLRTGPACSGWACASSWPCCCSCLALLSAEWFWRKLQGHVVSPGRPRAPPPYWWLFVKNPAPQPHVLLFALLDRFQPMVVTTRAWSSWRPGPGMELGLMAGDGHPTPVARHAGCASGVNEPPRAASCTSVSRTWMTAWQPGPGSRRAPPVAAGHERDWHERGRLPAGPGWPPVIACAHACPPAAEDSPGNS